MWRTLPVSGNLAHDGCVAEEALQSVPGALSARLRSFSLHVLGARLRVSCGHLGFLAARGPRFCYLFAWNMLQPGDPLVDLQALSPFAGDSAGPWPLVRDSDQPEALVSFFLHFGPRHIEKLEELFFDTAIEEEEEWD